MIDFIVLAFDESGALVNTTPEDLWRALPEVARAQMALAYWNAAPRYGVADGTFDPDQEPLL
jgi:hypothetical protein